MYDCMIVGGGIAGLQAAIQLGRYRHQVLVVDKGRGRSTLCRSYHNVLGWPDGIAGSELRRLGRQQAERLGVSFRQDEAVAAAKFGEDFEISLSDGGASVQSRTLLIATGITDRYPPLPGLEETLGLSVYVCPDCDGYEVSDKRTIVMGAGNVGAEMALTLHYWTNRIVFVNHERTAVGSEKLDKLKQRGIVVEETEIAQVLSGQGGAEGTFGGVRLTDGRIIDGERGFIAFGGNAVHTEWAASLGLERLENKHIVTDPRTKMTRVPGVWAAGDIGVHSEQLTIAMGEGAQAAIWMHKELLKRTADKAVTAQS
ncbi:MULTISPECIES: NAD(P)/FAD-dependent oxidoreductase [unclassified Paenibacillus]|uniref:NAD(P)/FAD-dependent oxidoreductase n=1 Tax=unclassified Paenibacillus TaxID=185978 RepID=UPI001AE3CE31|nr:MULTISPECIES: NAD(P)/FAD-dependent oxidoreductase [unclassified Paenibacillus]MBP1154440.1 thioredoxin reductase [Paenibacillus sp. PvP091]MBP1170176.1 thioredoxin reductase [Paenibacillus sp. PvR098]MBP2441204.1 thioredoxin reductase [Paenibacillus sp. PvP052]